MDTLITTLVDGILVPLIGAVTAPIPFLASSGILLIVFAALWVAFAVALVREPQGIERTWRRLRALPIIVQAIAWLLLLPVLAGITVWRTDWPQVARVALVGALAGWNLLMFLPRRPRAEPSSQPPPRRAAGTPPRRSSCEWNPGGCRTARAPSATLGP